MRKSSSVPALESIEDQTQKLPWIDERHGSSKHHDRMSNSLMRIDNK